MREVRESLYKFIVDYDPKGEEILKKIFRKEAQKGSFTHLIPNGEKDIEDLFHDFYLNKILHKRENFIKIFRTDQEGIISYIKTSIRNYLKDKLEKKRLEEISITLNTKENETINIVELTNNPDSFKPIEYMEAVEITGEIQKFLTKDELKTLCHIVFKSKADSNYCLEDLSSDAKYKRIERLRKNKLKSFVEKHSFSVEGFELFLKEFLMSEICRKICSK